MSVDTGADEKTFVDLSLAISSLVKILVATGLNFFLATNVKISKSRLNSLVNAY